MSPPIRQRKRPCHVTCITIAWVAIKNPVGVGETYGVRREETLRPPTTSESWIQFVQLGFLCSFPSSLRKGASDAALNVGPTGFGSLVDGDEIP